MDGFLLVDKPGDITSHDVVDRVRRSLGIRKVGHAGTLDPMATGLLVLGVGRATRLLRFVQGRPKVYVATMLLGVATESLDADGAILSREPMPVGEDEITAASRRFVGPILQVPPMVSAIRVGGRRLHEIAREGGVVDREARPVEVYDLEVLDVAPSDYPEVSFRVRCSTGTYVRSLADDWARALGGRAHLTALRRTAIGSLEVDEAVALDAIEDAGGRGQGADLVMTPLSGLRDLPVAAVGDDVAPAIANGVAVPAQVLGVEPGAAGPHCVVGTDGALLAVYRVDGRRTAVEVVLS